MKFLHVMIKAHDLKKTLCFYEELLGLTVVRTLQGDDCNIFFLGSEENGEVEIEVLDEFEKPKEYIVGTNVGHFGFATSDMEEVGRKLHKLGYEWYKEPFYMEKVNSMLGFIKDPNGNEIEFIQKLQ